MEIEKISKAVESLVSKLVNEELESLKEYADYEEAFNYIVFCMFHSLQDAKDTYKAFKKQKLTLNALEAEGGVRALEALIEECNSYSEKVRKMIDKARG